MPQLAIYRKTLGFAQALRQLPDKRSINGLDHQIEELKKCEATLAESNALVVLKRDITVICPVFHQPTIFTVEDEALNAAITHMRTKIEDKDWPKDVVHDLLSRRLGQLKDAGNYVELTNALDPVFEKPLDFQKIAVGSIPGSTVHSRIAVYTRIYWKECMVGLLSAGRESTAVVSSMAEAGLRAYNDIDPVDHEPIVCEKVQQWNMCWEFLKALLDSKIGIECQALRAIRTTITNKLLFALSGWPCFVWLIGWRE